MASLTLYRWLEVGPKFFGLLMLQAVTCPDCLPYRLPDMLTLLMIIYIFLTKLSIIKKLNRVGENFCHISTSLKRLLSWQKKKLRPM